MSNHATLLVLSAPSAASALGEEPACPTLMSRISGVTLSRQVPLSRGPSAIATLFNSLSCAPPRHKPVSKSRSRDVRPGGPRANSDGRRSRFLVSIQVLFGSTLPVRRVSFDAVCCVPISLATQTAEAAVTGSRQGRHLVSGMIDDLESLAHRVSDLTAALADRDAVIAVQAARIAELERRLGLDSSNSGKPPSRDGLTQPTAEALRQRQRSRRRASDRKPGGQRGYPGGTLRRSDHPDVIADHDPDVCTGCGAALDAGMSVGSAARQVHDLPEPPPLQVTAHRAHRCVCPACGVTTRAHFPAGVTAPVQSGPRLTARVVYLRVAQLVPVQRLRQTLIDLFGVQRSQGTVMNMVSRAAAGLEGLILHVRDAVAASPVKHMDETGIRVRGRLAWLHVAGTEGLSHFRVGAGRGDVMRDATGVAVHDHWRPYVTIPGTVPACCAGPSTPSTCRRESPCQRGWPENRITLSKAV